MIEIIFLDVDGTLSKESLIYHNQNGEIIESGKIFNVKDGLSLAYWKQIGRKVAIISGRDSKIVRHRANELKIDFIFMGIKDKGKCIKEIKKNLNLTSAACAAIGDDVNDIPMFLESSLSFAPSNASNAIKDIVNVNLSRAGGDGAIREMIEFILKKENLYEKFIEYWK